MPFSSRRYHRRSLRMRGYDYAQPGGYFVTLCVEGKAQRLASVVDGEIALTPAGKMVEEEWLALPSLLDGLLTDVFVVMPDHFHGILLLDTDGGPQRPSLASVVQRFKSRTTVLYTRGVKELGWPAFCGRLWQRNYYEHIIRNERDLDEIRDYIRANPSAWLTGRHAGL